MTEKQKNVVGFIVMIAVLAAMPFLVRAWEQEEERMNQEKYEEVVQKTVHLIQAGSYRCV